MRLSDIINLHATRYMSDSLRAHLPLITVTLCLSMAMFVFFKELKRTKGLLSQVLDTLHHQQHHPPPPPPAPTPYFPPMCETPSAGIEIKEEEPFVLQEEEEPFVLQEEEEPVVLQEEEPVVLQEEEPEQVNNVVEDLQMKVEDIKPARRTRKRAI